MRRKSKDCVTEEFVGERCDTRDKGDTHHFASIHKSHAKERRQEEEPVHELEFRPSAAGLIEEPVDVEEERASAEIVGIDTMRRKRKDVRFPKEAAGAVVGYKRFLCPM